ncbi:MAG: hypothetical protein E5W82_28925 [Mesorhizobium sp.]|nr:MAG: hypothetical protein E5W82_28925 [Mesorhizobium sp.]
MALLMMLNVSINASMLAAASPQVIVDHLAEHEQNFERLGQKKAAHMAAAMVLLVKNAARLT